MELFWVHDCKWKTGKARILSQVPHYILNQSGSTYILTLIPSLNGFENLRFAIKGPIDGVVARFVLFKLLVSHIWVFQADLVNLRRVSSELLCIRQRLPLVDWPLLFRIYAERPLFSFSKLIGQGRYHKASLSHWSIWCIATVHLDFSYRWVVVVKGWQPYQSAQVLNLPQIMEDIDLTVGDQRAFSHHA